MRRIKKRGTCSMAKKLIEVALPLEKINAESAREKSIRHGHPSTLHLWWARRPLAAARAVIWSSLVDDPSSHPEMFQTEEEQNKERQKRHAGNESRQAEIASNRIKQRLEHAISSPKMKYLKTNDTERAKRKSARKRGYS